MKKTVFFILMMITSTFYEANAQVQVKLNDMSYASGASIAAGSPIEITNGQSVRILFTVELTKTGSTSDGYIIIYTRKGSLSPVQQGAKRFISNNSWSTLNVQSYDVTLNSSDFYNTNNKIYAEFVTNSGLRYTSRNNWSIVINGGAPVTTPGPGDNSICCNQSITNQADVQEIKGLPPVSTNLDVAWYRWQYYRSPTRYSDGGWITIGINTKDFHPNLINNGYGNTTTRSRPHTYNRSYTYKFRRVLMTRKGSKIISNTVDIIYTRPSTTIPPRRRSGSSGDRG
ncbi:hypothetical protein OOZ15_12810 [Galbibacter sp. EGI 63066]|uniref:hypothetical protein n=1 Tax=Galbibacter sp. EGI 63066 TaxID=2993559 RepID=UPI002249935F|nr:hypothetical protein [Galbibacter sp. EGI 63066]MCX2680827.1 hypothetical protein [Galbibacter sp. EGI 63066]